MGRQVLRKLHAGGADIHRRTIIISSGREASSFGAFVISVTKLQSRMRCLIPVRSITVQYSPLPHITPFKVKPATKGAKSNLLLLPKETGA